MQENHMIIDFDYDNETLGFELIDDSSIPEWMMSKDCPDDFNDIFEENFQDILA